MKFNTYTYYIKIIIVVNSPLGKGWPLNHHFVFDLLCVGAVVVAVISLLLPKSIEMQRKREP